jgi:hypothetical protein
MGSIMNEAVVREDDVEVEQFEPEVEVTESPEVMDEAVQEGETAPEDSEDIEDEVVISIDGESPTQEDEKEKAPEWVRELRKSHRELKRENRELRTKLTTQTTEIKPVTLGKKPSLDDFDYDTDKFESALANWFEQKRIVDQQRAQAEAAAREQQEAWQNKLQSYVNSRAELKVRDYEDAEDIVQNTLDVTQQGVLLQGAENPAVLVYALGKNPKKAKELSDIKDPVKFAFAVAKLETQLKVQNRKSAPPPEKTIQSSGRISGSVDSTLERLRAEAERTGNYTKVLQYKRSKREAAK